MKEKEAIIEDIQVNYDRCFDTLRLVSKERDDLRARLAAAEGERDRLQDEMNFIESVCWWDGHRVTVKKLLEVMATLKAELDSAKVALKVMNDNLDRLALEVQALRPPREHEFTYDPM
jgi:chromosome segregation ATPase